MNANTLKAVELDTFTRAYIACALWSSTGDEECPLDSTYSQDDLHESALSQIVADCEAFQRDNREDLEFVSMINDAGNSGHDFWLTRNHHGAGFWDRYMGKDCDLKTAFARLTGASHAFGECDLYVGDDGKIYVH